MPIQPDRLNACAIANIPVPATTQLVFFISIHMYTVIDT